MPLDAVCLTALLRELAPELEGARIDKVIVKKAVPEDGGHDDNAAAADTLSGTSDRTAAAPSRQDRN